MKTWEKDLGIIVAVLSFVTLICAVIYRPLIWVSFGLMIILVLFMFIEQYEEY